MHPAFWGTCGPRSGFFGRRGHRHDHRGRGESHGHEAEHEGYSMRGDRDEPRGGPFAGGGPFGVRRPLRFLAFKLGLEDAQIAQLARILDELKTERAQAEVDDRRTLADFADAVSAEAFDATKATAGGERRSASAVRVRDAVISALRQIHAMLDADQRERLAYLIRTGVLSL